MTLKIRTGRIAADTSGRTQDFTISDFGTPKAALFIVTPATADNTPADDAILSIGFTDGTTDVAATAAAEHNTASSDTNSEISTAACIYMEDEAQTVLGQASFNSWITNGIKLDWDTNFGTAVLITYVLFGGTDLSVHVGSQALTNGATHNITSPAFRPTDVIALTADETLGSNGLCFGFVHDESGTVTQVSNAYSSRNGRPETDCSGYTSNQYGSFFLRGDGVLYNTCTFSGFDNDGFDVTVGGSNLNGSTLLYLALRIENHDSACGVIETPTTTGTDPQTDPGHKPQSLLQIGTNHAAINTNYRDQHGSPFGFFFADASNQYSVFIADESDADPTNTESQVDDQLAILHADNGTALFAATLTSFDTNGWTPNYSAVNETNATQWLCWSVEEESSSSPQTVTPAAHTNTSTVHQPTINPGTTAVEPDTFVNSSVFHEITVITGTAVSPDHLINTSVFHDPTITTEPATVEPDAFVNNSTFYAPTINPGAVTVEPDTFVNSSIFYDPTISFGIQYTDGYGGDINTAQDMLLNPAAPTHNTGTHTSLALDGHGAQIQHNLLRFNLSAIPANATCISAKLCLYHNYAPEGDAYCNGDVFSIAEANKDWIEGTGNFDIALAGEPCWDALEADGSEEVQTAWAGSAGCSTSGTDYESTSLGSFSFYMDEVLGHEYTIDLLASRIEDWFGASNTNYGIIIIPTSGDMHVGSSDNSTPGYRPKLVVTYQESTATTVEPDAFVNNSTFHAPTINPGAVTVEPDTFVNSSIFYNPTIDTGVTAVTPDHLTNSQTVHEPTINPGAITASPNAVTNNSAVHEPTVNPGAVTAEPDTFVNSSTFYQITVITGTAIDLDTFVNTTIFHDPTINPEPTAVQLDVFTNTNTLHPPFVAIGAEQTVTIDHLLNVPVFYIQLFQAIPATRVYYIEAEDRTLNVKR